MRVTVVWSPEQRQVWVEEVDVPDGATVSTALECAGWAQRFGSISSPDVAFGVWNKPAQLKTPLKDFDRVEIYRSLTADPKEARRLRFSNQGKKSAGLFAKQRHGAKAGY